MTPSPEIRPATVKDIDELIELRVLMQTEVGNLTDPAQEPAFRDACRKYFGEALPTGAFRGWVADVEGRLVAANGAVFYEKVPSVRGLSGRQGYISNVYTRPEWRRKGLATRLMQALIEHSRQSGVTKLRLEATEASQEVYVRVGFKPTRFPALELQL